MRDLNELNVNEGGEPVNRTEPTPDHLAFVENLVGAQLPNAYVDFLRFSNGGHPELDTFYIQFEDHSEDWSVNRFFHISNDHDSTDNVVWKYHHRWKGAPRTVLPIADDGGGDIIALDLDEASYGRVVLRVHDDPNLPLIHIAGSFEEFINLLEINPDDS